MPKWYVTALIDIYMTSPSVILWKTVQHRQDYLSQWITKLRTQFNTKTGPQTDDVWRILWRQREREAVATDFLRRPYATPEWRWFWHTNKIYGITAFMLNGLYQNMPVFLEDNFLILEHKVSFGFIPYPSSVLIYKKSSTGETGIDSPTVMSVERSATKVQWPRLGMGMRCVSLAPLLQPPWKPSGEYLFAGPWHWHLELAGCLSLSSTPEACFSAFRRNDEQH